MRYPLAIAACLASTALATSAIAQTAQSDDSAVPPAAPAEGTGSDSDIVVTALKTGQTAFQAPATITVVQTEELASKNIVAGNQLNAIVPGLTMSVGVGGLPGTSFRGLGSNAAVFNLEPSVAEYIDGVYQPHARDYVAPLYDVDHVEFIKGTQSTLLGKNTSLGAISIVNHRPANEFDYFLQYNHGFGVDSDRVQGAFNVPLSGTLSARAAFIFSNADGWIKNVVRGLDEGEQKDVSGRFSLSWKPNDTFDVFLNYQHDYRHVKGQALEVVSDPTGAVAARAVATGASFDTRGIGHSASAARPTGGTVAGPDPYDKQKTDRLNAIVNVYLNDFTLTSQTAYTEWKSPRVTDLDFTQANLFNLYDDERSKTFTQEVRLASPRDGRVQGLIGFFYYFNRWSYGRNFASSPSNTVGFPFTGQAVSQTELPTRAYSIFASGTIELLEGLKIDGGLRYTHEKKEGSFVRTTTGRLANAFPTTPFTVYSPQVTKPLDFNIGARYQVNPAVLFYGSYSKGSKSGGFQDAPTTIAGAPFTPETAYSAEIGAKIRLPNGYLTVAAFNTRVNGFQTSYTAGVGTPPVSQTVLGNANTRSRGFEASASYKPMQGLTVAGSVVYAKSTFTDDFPANASIGRDGDLLTRAPKWSGNVTVDYETDVSDRFTGFAGVRADFASKTLFQFQLPQPAAPFGEAHGTIDARIGLRTSDKRWEFAVLGTNVFDRRFVDFATSITAGGGAYYGSFNRPRVVALQVTARR